MSNIFLRKRKNINNLSKYKIISINKEIIDSKYVRHFPPANLDWSNSIYAFNKNYLKLLPKFEQMVTKLIKSYFHLYHVKNKYKQTPTIRRLRIISRRLSINRIFVSKADIKHTNNKVIFTVYIYNGEKRYLLNKLKKIDPYLYFFIWLNKKIKKKIWKKKIRRNFKKVRQVKKLKIKLEKQFLDKKERHFRKRRLKIHSSRSKLKRRIRKRKRYLKKYYTKRRFRRKNTKRRFIRKRRNRQTRRRYFEKKKNILNKKKKKRLGKTIKKIRKKALKVIKLTKKIFFKLKKKKTIKWGNKDYSVTQQYKKFLKKSLIKEKYKFYYKNLLWINKSKFEKTLLNPFNKLLCSFFEKKIQFNIVNLKYLHLNSSIFPQLIAIKIKNRKNRALRAFTLFLRKVKLPSFNKISKTLIYLDKKFTYLDLTKKILLNKVKSFKNFKKVLFKQSKKKFFFDLFNQTLQKIFLKKKKIQIKKKSQKDNYIQNTILKTIKYRVIAGVRIEASGRFSRRLIAARSVFRFRRKGTLKNLDSSYEGLSTVMLRGYAKSNIQYTKISSKTRNGSFGLKGWINTM